MALAIVILWFGFVAVYLVRQWWVSELVQARDGVPAPALVTLPAAPQAPVAPAAPAATAASAPVAYPSAPVLPVFTWSTLHASGTAAR